MNIQLAILAIMDEVESYGNAREEARKWYDTPGGQSQEYMDAARDHAREKFMNARKLVTDLAKKIHQPEFVK